MLVSGTAGAHPGFAGSPGAMRSGCGSRRGLLGPGLVLVAVGDGRPISCTTRNKAEVTRTPRRGPVSRYELPLLSPLGGHWAGLRRGYGLPHWHVGGSSTADMVAASSAVTGARAVRILLVLWMKLLPVLARAWLPRKLDRRICRSIRGLILGSRGGWGARLYGGAWGQPAEAAPSNADIKPVSLHGPPLSAGSRPDRETRPERAVYGCARFSR